MSPGRDAQMGVPRNLGAGLALDLMQIQSVGGAVLSERAGVDQW